MPRRIALVAAIAGAMVVAATMASVRLAGDTDRPPTRAAFPVTSSGPPRVAVVTVTYEVTGKGRSYITYHDPKRTPSSVTLPDQRLPWRIELARQPSDWAMVSTSRDEYESGPHRVRILIDGVELCTSQDDGVYTRATCGEPVPQS
jgi:hypothetical protein